MKILAVTDTSLIGTSYPLVQALMDAGHCLTVIPLFLVDASGDRIKVLDPAMRRLQNAGAAPDVTGANKSVLKAIAQGPYDLLWVIKALPIRPLTLRRAKVLQPSMRLVYSSEDDMFLRHNQSKWLLGCLSQYDVVFTNKSRNVSPDELPSLGCKKVVFIDKSYCPHRHRPLPVTEEDRLKLGGQVAFIGRFEEERAQSMLYLAQHGIDVRVWGHTWPKEWKQKHRRLRVEGRKLIGDDYTRAICATDINLGFLRRLNRDTQTNRTMEITASGGFLLAERTDEHLRLFTEGKEAAYFETDRELLEKVHLYLDKSEAATQIAEAGRKRCQKSGYSYIDRLPEMFSHMTA